MQPEWHIQTLSSVVCDNTDCPFSVEICRTSTTVHVVHYMYMYRTPRTDGVYIGTVHGGAARLSDCARVHNGAAVCLLSDCAVISSGSGGGRQSVRMNHPDSSMWQRSSVARVTWLLFAGYAWVFLGCALASGQDAVVAAAVAAPTMQLVPMVHCVMLWH